MSPLIIRSAVSFTVPLDSVRAAVSGPTRVRAGRRIRGSRHQAPGGETACFIHARMRRVIDTVTTRHPGATIVLVSHGTFLHIGLTELLRNVSPEWAEGFPLVNAGTIVALHGPDGLRCETWCGAVPPGDS
ncbi:histidine phosphatase family protein [Nonomuraea sp. NPDC048901]|uniref:histidine phosphatase family protein n=1 Tax=Nonomuraea sp. NPDC048901 TaxID=3155627 RepID=UPI003406C7FF